MSEKKFKYYFDKPEMSANSVLCHVQVILWKPFLPSHAFMKAT